MKRVTFTISSIVGAAVLGCVLGFYGTSVTAAPQQNVPPFANPSGNRNEMIVELRNILNETKKQNQLLTEQNNLLKSGKLRVILMLDQK